MDFVRTPEDRFENLAGYDFAAHYEQVPDGEGGQLRVHYVDEGPRESPAVLLLHGEPTWSYLYRTMIPPLVAAGHRVLAPDLVGFGKSDKPTQKTDYTFERHVAWMRAWLEQLDLTNLTLFGQDWGSLIGLTLCSRVGDRFDRIVIANGGLPDPRNLNRMIEVQNRDSHDPGAFARWQNWIAEQEQLDASQVLTGEMPGLELEGLGVPLSEAEKTAYRAPFPDSSYQAGALVFPLLAPRGAPEDLATLQTFAQSWEALDRWEKPLLTAFGKRDPILGWFDTILREQIPGAKGRAHVQFDDGNHFIQEQYGPELANVVADLIAST